MGLTAMIRWPMLAQHSGITAPVFQLNMHFRTSDRGIIPSCLTFFVLKIRQTPDADSKEE